jgi:hypothetical protein
MDAPLEVSTQLMALRAGLYAVELAPMRTTRGKGGIVLPCARLDRLPEAEADVHVAALTATGLLEPGQYPTFMAVTGDASVLLTIYKLGGPSAAPEVRIRFMGTLGAPAAAAEVLDSLPLKVEPGRCLRTGRARSKVLPCGSRAVCRRTGWNTRQFWAVNGCHPG